MTRERLKSVESMVIKTFRSFSKHDNVYRYYLITQALCSDNSMIAICQQGAIAHDGKFQRVQFSLCVYILRYRIHAVVFDERYSRSGNLISVKLTEFPKYGDWNF